MPRGDWLRRRSLSVDISNQIFIQTLELEPLREPPPVKSVLELGHLHVQARVLCMHIYNFQSTCVE